MGSGLEDGSGMGNDCVAVGSVRPGPDRWGRPDESAYFDGSGHLSCALQGRATNVSVFNGSRTICMCVPPPRLATWTRRIFRTVTFVPARARRWAALDDYSVGALWSMGDESECDILALQPEGSKASWRWRFKCDRAFSTSLEEPLDFYVSAWDHYCLSYVSPGDDYDEARRLEGVSHVATAEMQSRPSDETRGAPPAAKPAPFDVVSNASTRGTTSARRATEPPEMLDDRVTPRRALLSGHARAISVTDAPTALPTYAPTVLPTPLPTILPTASPSILPTVSPVPSTLPTLLPTPSPSLSPVPTIVPNPTAPRLRQGVHLFVNGDLVRSEDVQLPPLAPDGRWEDRFVVDIGRASDGEVVKAKWAGAVFGELPVRADPKDACDRGERISISVGVWVSRVFIVVGGLCFVFAVKDDDRCCRSFLFCTVLIGILALWLVDAAQNECGDWKEIREAKWTYMRGHVDEVVIYDRALEPEEIAELASTSAMTGSWWDLVEHKDDI